MAKKKGTKRGKKNKARRLKKSKGRIPMSVLKERYAKLGKIISSRGGQYDD